MLGEEWGHLANNNYLLILQCEQAPAAAHGGASPAALPRQQHPRLRHRQRPGGLAPDFFGPRGVRERRLAKFRQNVARFRLYRLRFLQENMRFAAFFKIYQILKLKFLKFDKILQILRHLQFFC